MTEKIIPDGYKLVAVKGLDELVYWLERCKDKGHLENCADLIEPFDAFEYRNISEEAVIAAHKAKASPAVPQGWKLVPVEVDPDMVGAFVDASAIEGPCWAEATDDEKQEVVRMWAPCWAALLAATPAAPSQDRIEMTLRDYADSLVKAGHDFWKACRRDAGGGAVRWLSCDDGTLIVFTRGEYRDAIMGAVGGYRATEVVFEDQANDEQGGVVACAAPSQPVTLTDRQFDLICQAIDKADTITMEGDYMLDSDDCIGVVRVMQALFSIAALREKEQAK